METRRLGNSDVELSALGLGLMGMSGMYGPSDRDESLATIDAAVEAGITLFDTGDFYGMGHNEMLLGEALKRHRREDLFIAVKFGAQRSPDGAFIGYDARPQAVKTFLAYTLQRLGVDHIDLYQPARLDPAVPIEDTVGAIKDMVDAGYVRHIGLSEMSAATLARAHAVHPISWLQIEYSLASRGIEAEILPAARSLGVSISAYGVLSRGLISGHWSPQRAETGGDFRAHQPRFSGENVTANLALVDALGALAERFGTSTAQLAIAWVLAQGQDVIPLVGARTRTRLSEALGALKVELGSDQIAAIETAFPADAVAGSRYDTHQMQMLDSERGTTTA